MRNIQILIKRKRNNHQYFQCKYDEIFIDSYLYRMFISTTVYTKKELLTVADTRNIRDAVASKLFAAIRQAAIRC